MKRTELFRKFEGLLELEAGSLTGREELTALPGWDSLALMSYIALVDRNFGVRLSGKQLAECQTVSDLANLLGDKVTPA